MEEKEDKGFVFKDRRKMYTEEADAEAGAKEAKPDDAQEGAKGSTQEEASASGRERKHGPLPELTFSTLVVSLSSSALMHLGDIPEPETQQTYADLPLAKQVIDTLGMLQEKTKGNLDADEDRLLRSVLYDLRMRFLQKSGK